MSTIDRLNEFRKANSALECEATRLRAEVERLKAENERLTRERDEAQKLVCDERELLLAMKTERDAARAETAIVQQRLDATLASLESMNELVDAARADRRAAMDALQVINELDCGHAPDDCPGTCVMVGVENIVVAALSALEDKP